MSDSLSIAEKKNELQALERRWGDVPVALRMMNLGVTALLLGAWWIWGVSTWVWWAWGGWLAARYGFEVFHPKISRLYELRRAVAEAETDSVDAANAAAQADSFREDSKDEAEDGDF